jgi:hypothetical protein
MYGPIEMKGDRKASENIFPKVPTWMGSANRFLIARPKLKRSFLSKNNSKYNYPVTAYAGTKNKTDSNFTAGIDPMQL